MLESLPFDAFVRVPPFIVEERRGRQLVHLAVARYRTGFLLATVVAKVLTLVQLLPATLTRVVLNVVRFFLFRIVHLPIVHVVFLIVLMDAVVHRVQFPAVLGREGLLFSVVLDILVIVRPSVVGLPVALNVGHLLAIQFLLQPLVLGGDLGPVVVAHLRRRVFGLVSLRLVEKIDDLLFVTLSALYHLLVQQFIQLLVFRLQVVNDFLELTQLLLHGLGLLRDLLRLM